jgi:hypothetical protein
MRSTCIQHPTREPLLIIRQWQLTFCEGNHCAAALLSLFEYWHNLRLDLSQRAGQANEAARQHGQPATQEESLLQFHSDEQLQAGLLDLYGTKKIRESRHLLVEKGVITEHPNPNPRYAFDKTLYFQFHPEVINAWLDQRRNSPAANPSPADEHNPPSDQSASFGDSSNNNVTCGKNAERVGKNADSYTEITYEITSETTTTTLPSSSTNERAAEPETARGGGGDQDQNPEDPDGDPGETAQEPNEEKTVGKEEAQPVAATEGSSDTTTENPKTVASEEATDEQRPELTYPAKLTEQEQEDIAAQVYPLPAEIAQQMLDVIEAKIKGGQVKTSPAAVLRGIVRKYQVDPESFDPSSGFQIAEARRRRAEADARLRAEADRRVREREAPRVAPGAAEVRRQSIASMLRSLRGH